jgi:hypothetical protein
MKRTASTWGCVALATLAALGASAATAGEWPTYGGDNRRSRISRERLDLPLKLGWIHQATAPRPAWPAPAKQDFWHRQGNLVPSITFDRTNHVVAAEGAVLFGSTADDKVTCLDAAAGTVRWSFFAEGPVRLAPTVAAGRVYCGSDDGHVYCLDAQTGELLWKHRVGPTDRRLPGNGRMISPWPVRSGVLVADGTAYCCAGLFPSYGVYLAALDAETGRETWKRKLSGVSPQGYMLASEAQLFVPSGRNSPAVFDRQGGTPRGLLQENQRGGSYALLAEDTLVHRGSEEGSLGISDVRTKERIVLFGGLHLIVRGETAFVGSGQELAAFRRTQFLKLARERNRVAARKATLEEQIKALRQRPNAEQIVNRDEELRQVKLRLEELAAAMSACWTWRRSMTHPHALILVGDLLFAGGDNEVAAYGAEDGNILWQAPVRGKAYGLAVAAGRLFVSTDQGSIHCFQ